MKKYTVTVVLLMGCIFSVNAACAKTIERSDLSHLRIKEESGGRVRRLHVRISMLESMKIIGKPRSKISGNTMHIFLPLHVFGSLNKANKVAGQSDFFIAIPQGIERVTLGKQNCEIWPRDLCAKTLDPDEARAQDIALKQFNIDFPNIVPFDIGIQVTQYGSSHGTTYLKNKEPGYEVVVNYPQGRVIYQISSINFKIIQAVKQQIGANGTYQAGHSS